MWHHRVAGRIHALRARTVRPTLMASSPAATPRATPSIRLPARWWAMIFSTVATTTAACRYGRDARACSGSGDLPALLLRLGEALLVVERIDRKRLAAFGAGHEVVDLGPDALDDHRGSLPVDGHCTIEAGHHRIKAASVSSSGARVRGAATPRPAPQGRGGLTVHQSSDRPGRRARERRAGSPTETVLCAAILHDTIEDTDTTLTSSRPNSVPDRGCRLRGVQDGSRCPRSTASVSRSSTPRGSSRGQAGQARRQDLQPARYPAVATGPLADEPRARSSTGPPMSWSASAGRRSGTRGRVDRLLARRAELR